jgi:hypothetical protein
MLLVAGVGRELTLLRLGDFETWGKAAAVQRMHAAATIVRIANRFFITFLGFLLHSLASVTNAPGIGIQVKRATGCENPLLQTYAHARSILCAYHT